MDKILGYKGIVVTEENYADLKVQFPDLDPPTPPFVCCPHIPAGFITTQDKDTKEDGTSKETR